jgi:hypothetical protein
MRSFHSRKLVLSTCSSKNGTMTNAVNLKELLGFGNYDTAWTWLQKLRRCTIGPDREKLSGHVEVDEFFIGGQCSGKRGRSAEGKTLVFIAVERSATEKQMGRIRLHVALDCSGYSLETFSSSKTSPPIQRSQPMTGGATMSLIKNDNIARQQIRAGIRITTKTMTITW